jgi:hypothetical protein
MSRQETKRDDGRNSSIQHHRGTSCECTSWESRFHLVQHQSGWFPTILLLHFRQPFLHLHLLAILVLLHLPRWLQLILPLCSLKWIYGRIKDWTSACDSCSLGQLNQKTLSQYTSLKGQLRRPRPSFYDRQMSRPCWISRLLHSKGYMYRQRSMKWSEWNLGPNRCPWHLRHDLWAILGGPIELFPLSYQTQLEVAWESIQPPSNRPNLKPSIVHLVRI